MFSNDSWLHCHACLLAACPVRAFRLWLSCDSMSCDTMSCPRASAMARLDNNNHFTSFLAKKRLHMTIVLTKKLCDYRSSNCYFFKKLNLTDNLRCFQKCLFRTPRNSKFNTELTLFRVITRNFLLLLPRNSPEFRKCSCTRNSAYLQTEVARPSIFSLIQYMYI
jgi:hypothetical protein